MPGSPHAVVRDVPASWNAYVEAAHDLEGQAPKGLLAHAAGPTDEGFRVVDVWASRVEWEQFRDRRPATALDGALPRPGTEGTFREFEVRDLYLASTPRFVTDRSG
jgi:hypothetical protein